MDRREFDGKHVLVTGGTKRIGAAVSTRLREGGCDGPYHSRDYLKERHGLPQDLLQNIAVVETLAAKAAE